MSDTMELESPSRTPQWQLDHPCKCGGLMWHGFIIGADSRPLFPEETKAYWWCGEPGRCGRIERDDGTVLREVATICADDDEPILPDDAIRLGFVGGNDEPDVDVYDFRCGNGGLVIRLAFRFSRGEITESSLGIAWSYRGSASMGTISLAYGIEDNPTLGAIKRLLAALAVSKEKP